MDLAPTLDFVMLYVADLDQALDYYTRTLGFRHLPEGDTPIFRQLAGGEGGASFAIRQADETTPPPGMVELYFKTADLDGLRAAWTGKGVEATPIASRPFGRIFTIRTPDGQSITALH